MRFTTTLPLVAVAVHAFVLPDAKLFSELDLQAHSSDGRRVVETLWDSLPDKESLLYAAGETIDYFSQGFEKIARAGKDAFEHAFDQELDVAELDMDHPRHPRHPHHPPKTSNLTIYELIKKSEHTSKFAELLGDYEGVVKILNSTDANFTLFVPTNAAFEKLPGHNKPSKEVVEAVLKYHIGLGLYPAIRILHTHTIPSAYNESWLGDKPQRLRTSVGFGGVRVNFFSKVVAANIPAKNGVIHAVDTLLLPPPPAGKILALLPQRFSTLLLAYEKTNFVDFIHKINLSGSTLFAPSNQAFARLGPKANAFLFNTPTGLKYLNAILKYHIVANSTLYSDAYYGDTSKSTDLASGRKHYHLDLPTLLENKSVAIDVARWGGWISLKLNGYVPVTVQDLVAKNGVVQVVGRVLIPPHKHQSGADEEVDGEIEVEDLKERLRGYVEDDEVPGDL